MLENLFVWMYPMVTIISIVAYIPQIKALITTKSDCREFSLSSWYLWIFSSFLSLGYGILHLKDFMFCLTTFASLVLMAAVVGLVLFRRYEWKSLSQAEIVAAE